MPRYGLVLGLSVASLVSSACGEEKNPLATADSAASANAGQPELGGRIDEAVKGLATASAAAPGQVAPNQPPPGGIFPPGVADRAHPAGAPPKLQLLGDGQDPKVVLHASVPKGQERVNVLLQMALGGKQLPALLVGLDVGPATGGGAEASPDKPAASAAPSAAAPAAGSAAAADLGPAPIIDQAMIATVGTVALPQMEEAPKELVDALKGAVIRFTMTKTGPTGFSRSFPTGTDPKLEQTLDLELGAIEDAFTAMYTPAPDKPVGEGGYWMVTDRRKSLGAEVIRYRVFTVNEIDGDSALLSVQIKQYMVDDKSDMTAFVRMENPVVIEYATEGKAALQVGPGSRFPKVGQLESQFQTTVIPGAAKGNPQAPHAELSVQVVAQTGPIELKAPGKDGKAKPKAKPNAP